MNRRAIAAFTLLEVMIAMAILSVSLIVVMDQAALVTQYQGEQILAATLARRKMVDLELAIEKDGFPADAKEECGTFEEDLADEMDQPNGIERFEYCWTLKEVDLPIPMDMLGGSGEGEGSGSGSRGTSAMAGALPGGISPEAIGEQLSKAVRVLTLTVKWKTGELPQELSVSMHLVNMTQAAVL